MAVVLVVCLLGPAFPPTSADAAEGSATWTEATWTAACKEAVLLFPIDHADVAPFVEPPFREAIVRAGPPGAEVATLVFTFNSCGDSRLVRNRQVFETDHAAEVILGVVVSSSRAEHAAQFYTLATWVDWEPLAAAFRALGLPTKHVPAMSIDFAIDAVLRTGTVDVDLPAPGERITASGDVVAAQPPPIDARASQFAVGPRGIVIVDHASHNPPSHELTPVAVGTVTTNRPDDMVAMVMGAPERDGAGIFFEKLKDHRHTARLEG